ncbi:hypothetical protein D0T90_01370 [Neisseria animalis]|uniref:Uncharacterized protein n=1 Tax=Neisseria animalis TaxID=492 RepID=A0A5P3MQH3_NEIAN|nr:hypothetical protein D0T90_01370 [Neisseria animalis]ROW33163.1 hypothetical protein CGZ60_00095 [Neisseria animalis]
MPCRTMCIVCGFAALSHSYFIRLYYPPYPPDPNAAYQAKSALKHFHFRNLKLLSSQAHFPFCSVLFKILRKSHLKFTLYRSL